MIFLFNWADFQVPAVRFRETKSLGPAKRLVNKWIMNVNYQRAPTKIVIRGCFQK